MGDSGSPPVFASPRVKEKVVNLASNLGAKYVWKTTTANNMRGGSKGHLGQLLLSIWNVWLDWMKMSPVIEEIRGGAVMFNRRCFVT